MANRQICSVLGVSAFHFGHILLLVNSQSASFSISETIEKHFCTIGKKQFECNFMLSS